MNLRNRMAHGYVSHVGPPAAAVLIHAALSLAAVAPPAVVADPATDDTDTGQPL